jgi:hypothetical protein
LLPGRQAIVDSVGILEVLSVSNKPACGK